MSANTTRDAAVDTESGVHPNPLNATVVHYRNGPDRCTVAPATVADERQLTAWLSMDTDALVTLAEMR